MPCAHVYGCELQHIQLQLTFVLCVHYCFARVCWVDGIMAGHVTRS